MLHALVALMVIVGPFPLWLFAVLPLVALSGWLNWCREGWPIHLRCRENEWFLIHPGRGVAAGLEALEWLPATRIGPRLALLHAKGSARRYFWPVASDSLPADEFRRLRVWVGLAPRVRR